MPTLRTWLLFHNFQKHFISHTISQHQLGNSMAKKVMARKTKCKYCVCVCVCVCNREQVKQIYRLGKISDFSRVLKGNWVPVYGVYKQVNSNISLYKNEHAWTQKGNKTIWATLHPWSMINKRVYYISHFPSFFSFSTIS